MLEYLEKFNNLPADVKQKISAGAVLARLEELESEYGVELANFVMRVMVGELYYKNLTANLIIEYNLAPVVANKLAKELEDKIFVSAMDYLSGAMSKKASPQPEVTSPFYGNKAAASGPVVRRAPVVAPQGGAMTGRSPFAKAAEDKPVNPPTPVNYLEEDKADIAAAGKLSTALKIVPEEKVNLMLGEVMNETRVSFASENLRKRFQELLLTYLRGVRTKVDVKENLLKDIASGGLKMSEPDADRILGIAQKKLAVDEQKFGVSPGKVSARSNIGGTSFIFNEEEIKQAIAQRTVPPKSKPASAQAMTGKPIDLKASAARDVDYDLTALRKRSAVAEDKPAAESDIGAVSLTGEILPQSLAKNIPSGALKITEAPKPPVIPAAAPKVEIPQPLKSADNETKRTAAVVGNKKRMEDIKPAPRTMSPIDELAYMDLVNFRRLDPVPSRRVAKIEEKIALLEKEGIDKKIEGIRVWRLNPVNKTYLAMGQESISSGKTIDVIMKERKDQGLNYLSKDEFEAVMDLNNNLRF
ncbi:MAG: hypothetical protein PHO56_04455 [Patescibacteria group bacterium]|nr:hypothetical protein [Patescibacteria group bacterium]